MEFQEYIRPELLILVPCLYFFGAALKKSRIKNKNIPWILGVVSVIMCGVWVVGNIPAESFSDVATAVFTAVTQGILLAGASVYVNQLVKQAKKE